MKLELTDWDQDLPPEPDEEYQALVRTLKFTEGFGLLFARCSPAEGEQLIGKVKEDITDKTIEVLRLKQAVTNLYEIIDKLENKEQIDILFITGLEYSFYEYEESKALTGWNSRDIYSYSWKSVPPVLINLNQQRERFRDSFNICFVFLLPLFAIKYFIQRAPDFFDWRSGLFEFPIDSETLEQESLRILQDGDYKKYLTLTPEERTQKILAIQELLAEKHQVTSSQAKLLLKLGSLQLAGQDYTKAIASYDQALKIKPDNHRACNNRGIALRNLELYEQAVASYDQALKIKPDYHQAWNNRGIALFNLERYEQAVASYDQALKIKPDYHQAWHNQGISLDDLGRYEQAVASYDQALKIKPDDHHAWYNRGAALLKLGRFEAAIASYDQALKFKPDFHEAWNWRGTALLKLGRLEEAFASYDQTLKIKPDYFPSWYNKACSYALESNIDQALQNLQQAINLNSEKCREWAKTDSDFDGIREDKRFKALIQ
ncbi:tetratricopeptide repeat protein [Nostoc sp. UHCC 0302]|uniref:tetratricopeptide repeat protein n=1 Tax=Nostoc sp. UHCC 0302 TaxID=3134896 RepID=UPI00311CCDE4